MDSKTLRRLSGVTLDKQDLPAVDINATKQEDQTIDYVNATLLQAFGDVNQCPMLFPAIQGIPMSLHNPLVEAMGDAPETPGYYFILTTDDCTEKYIGVTKNLKECFRRYYGGQQRKSKVGKEVFVKKDSIFVIYSVQDTIEAAYEKKNKLIDIFRSKHSGESPAWQKKDPQIN